jgi:MFS family permease
VSLTPAYVRYALCLLLVIYVLNCLDRSIVYILAEPIKRELQLADWQVGLMAGFAFAIFYAGLGIPIARLAEYRSRPTIIASSLALWSGLTALCGTANSFAMLCFYRVGVGVGEAGCTPAAYSLITDYVPKTRRASAMAFYSLGVPLGLLLGMALGGVISDRFGWRAAFLIAGAPGLLLAAIALPTLKETRSKLKADVAATKAHRPTIKQAVAILMSKRTYWLLVAGATAKTFLSYGQGTFIASFFLRNHTAELGQLAAGFGLKSVGFLGIVLGLINGGFGALGAVIGGWIADKVAIRDLRNAMLAPAVALFVSVPVFIIALLVDNTVLALGIMAIPYLLNNFWYGPVYATTQGIVPPAVRATATAILLFIITAVGYGLGPPLIGWLSDYLARSAGLGVANGLRWALISTSAIAMLASLFFVMARKTIRNDMVS